MSTSIDKKYQPWLLTSLAILVGSLVVLAAVGTMAFVSTARTPIWLILLGAVSAFGVALGFLGFFLIMLTAGWKSFRESRRVQVIPPDRQPEHSPTK
jgi:protein-S-isoprenylcysteine O-methyltransferase Ste14